LFAGDLIGEDDGLVGFEGILLHGLSLSEKIEYGFDFVINLAKTKHLSAYFIPYHHKCKLL
jgi:hypothetical protein